MGWLANGMAGSLAKQSVYDFSIDGSFIVVFVLVSSIGFNSIYRSYSCTCDLHFCMNLYTNI